MELMIVIAITLLLAVSITATLSISTEKGRKTKAMAEMAEIATACKMYYKDTGTWPHSIWFLINYPNYTPYFGYNQYGQRWEYFDKSKWKGPYLQIFNYPKDPWNKNYLIHLDTSESPYRLYVYASGSAPGGFTEALKVFIHKFRPIP